MARNIEIKARVDDMPALRDRVRTIVDHGPIMISQHDTFFPCPTGRLKVREFDRHHGELIFYQRADDSGPKESFYQRAETPDPHALRTALTLAYGTSGQVRKHRELYLIGRTRVHLDVVEGLGSFMELEVVLANDESPEIGMQEADDLIARLAIPRSALIDTAYVDLLSR